MQEEQKKETKPATPSKYTGLGASITAELMIGFWFGIGVTLANGVADSLNHFLGRLPAVATNEITTKMSERTQVNAASVEVPLQ